MCAFVVLAIGVAGLKDKHAVGGLRLTLIFHFAFSTPPSLGCPTVYQYILWDALPRTPSGLHPDFLRALMEPSAPRPPHDPAAQRDGARGRHRARLADDGRAVHGRTFQKVETRTACRQPFLHRGFGAADGQAPGHGPCPQDRVGAASNWLAVSVVRVLPFR